VSGLAALMSKQAREIALVKAKVDGAPAVQDRV
jgi:hypothetical protein